MGGGHDLFRKDAVLDCQFLDEGQESTNFWVYIIYSWHPRIIDNLLVQLNGLNIFKKFFKN